MTDMKALFTQRFDAARAALAQGDEPAAAESFHWAIVAARSDATLRRELASALFHLGKVSLKFGRAGETEADQLLTEALAISEEVFGARHAALAPVLTELSRLHVQRSQYARAEETLGRLLVIVRAKAEESADVAIALAGLAVVKRKLGDDASAETLYRDALRIREKVFEPNHLVIVITLEQLSDTCAARGNFNEAIALLRRALPAREASMGPGHEAARAARSRLAELELQAAVAADAAVAAAARAAMRTPAWFTASPTIPAPATPADTPLRIDSKELEFLGDPEPPLLRPSSPRDYVKTPAVAAAVAAASLMAAPIKTPAASMIAIPPRESARSASTVADFSYGGVVRDDLAPVDRISAVAAVHPEPVQRAPKKRAVWYATAVLTAAALAIAASMMRPRAGNGDKSVVARQAGGPPEKGIAIAGTTHADSAQPVSATSARAVPPALAAQPVQRTAQSALPDVRVPRIDVNLGAMKLPGAPTASDIDSLVHSAPVRQRASDSDRNTADRSTGDVGNSASVAPDVEDAPTPPKIIGRAPVPRFPDALLRSVRTEGQVMVRFKVNELGTVDVGSMVVIKSDNDLFTAAVRDILPLFRFEPARTHAPDAKPVAAWVSVPFRFSAKK